VKVGAGLDWDVVLLAACSLMDAALGLVLSMAADGSHGRNERGTSGGRRRGRNGV
jgi:hypothetical protein